MHTYIHAGIYINIHIYTHTYFKATYFSQLNGSVHACIRARMELVVESYGLSVTLDQLSLMRITSAHSFAALTAESCPLAILHLYLLWWGVRREWRTTIHLSSCYTCLSSYYSSLGLRVWVRRGWEARWAWPTWAQWLECLRWMRICLARRLWVRLWACSKLMWISHIHFLPTPTKGEWCLCGMSNVWFSDMECLIRTWDTHASTGVVLLYI